MKAIEVKTFGGPEVMQVVAKESYLPSKGEVVIYAKAIGVNPVETYIRAGTYPVLPELPYTPGGNVAGVIELCGEAVGDWKKGDRVYSSAALSGAYGEQVLCKTDQIFSLPEHLSFAQGAALGVPAATAWRALFIRGRAQPGEKVLIHGASGSVGQTAIQLAKGLGMEVFGTAGSEKGMALIEKLGAKPFDHKSKDYAYDLQEATGGTGFDLILEMLANQNLETDLTLLAPGGRVIIIGSRGRIEIDPRATMGKETEIRGLALLNATEEEIIETHQGLAGAMAEGILSPSVSRELSLEEAPFAHQLVMNDGNCGKIVLIP